MIIKYIKIKNMLSNSSDIEIDFMRKFKKEDEDLFFEKSIKNKKRSSATEAVLKKTVFLGKNASHKTSILYAIDISLSFIKECENVYFYDSFHNGTFEKWFKENKNELDIEDKENALLGMNKRKLIYSKFSEYLSNNITKENRNDEAFRSFFNRYAFNQEKELFINIIFYDEKEDKNYDYKLSFSNFENRKFIWEVKMNGEDIDLYKNKLEFKHDIVSLQIYNLNGPTSYKDTKTNRFLSNALQYFYYIKFDRNKKALIDFFSVLDPSIIDIKVEELTKDKLIVTSITRKYGNYIKDIPLSKLSAGTQIFIVYSYFILKNDFIIFDEIEQSLHFKLVELLIDLAKLNNKQILFSTHTPLLIEKFVKNYELYIFELNSENELEIVKGTQIYKSKDSFINKYMNDLVSNITDSDLEIIKRKLIYEK